MSQKYKEMATGMGAMLYHPDHASFEPMVSTKVACFLSWSSVQLQ